MDHLEESKDRYLNQWTHCGKTLHAQNAKIACDCGQSWDWVDTLGEMMEHLTVLEQVTECTPLGKSPNDDTNEPGFF